MLEDLNPKGCLTIVAFPGHTQPNSLRKPGNVVASSFLGRLYRYRERAKRGSLEDFTSEALCHLLNVLSRRQQAIVAQKCLVPKSVRDSFEREFLSAKRVRWSTQKRIDGRKILDLLVEADGVPLLIIENKIASPVGTHRADVGSDGEPENDLYQDQLTTYGRWLGQKRRGLGCAWPGAVTLLTHRTAIPSAFTQSGIVGDALPRAVRWGFLTRTIRDLSLSSECDATQAVIIDQFVNFLKERGMSDEIITPIDVAAGRIFFGSADALEGAFTAVSVAVFDSNDDVLTQGKLANFSVDYQGKMLWGWRYFHKDIGIEKAYVGWGIRYAYGSQKWIDVEPSLADADTIFVCLGPDGPKLPLDFLTQILQPKGWSSNEFDFVLAAPLSQFPQEPEAMNELMHEWILDKAKEAVDAMRAWSAQRHEPVE